MTSSSFRRTRTPVSDLSKIKPAARAAPPFHTTVTGMRAVLRGCFLDSCIPSVWTESANDFLQGLIKSKLSEQTDWPPRGERPGGSRSP
jgi:hypothetical protein